MTDPKDLSSRTHLKRHKRGQCPWCRSTRINYPGSSYGDLRYAGDVVEARFTCRDCDHSWEGIYRLVAVLLTENQ